jgi:hypothetical protein
MSGGIIGRDAARGLNHYYKGSERFSGLSLLKQLIQNLLIYFLQRFNFNILNF